MAGTTITKQVVQPIIGVSASITVGGDWVAKWVLTWPDGTVLSSDESALSDVSLELKMGYLVMRAPGMLRLDVPVEVIEDAPEAIETVRFGGGVAKAVDEGAWAAEWFTKVVGRPVRLLKLLHADAL